MIGMRTKRIVSLGLVAAVVGFGGYVVLKPPPSRAIAVATAVRQTVLSEVSATGTVQPSKVVALSFPGMGRVSEVNVLPGDIVNAGQVLATLDASAVRIDVTAKESALALSRKRLRAIEVSGSLDRSATVALTNQASVQSTANSALVEQANQVRAGAQEAAWARAAAARTQASSDGVLRDLDAARLATAQTKLSGFVAKRDEVSALLDKAKASTAAAGARREELRLQAEIVRSGATKSGALRDDARRGLEKAQADLERSRAMNPDAAANGVFVSDNLVVVAREKFNSTDRDAAAQDALLADAQRAYDTAVDFAQRQETAQAAAQARFDLADANVSSQTVTVEAGQRMLDTTNETARRSAENVDSVTKANDAENARDAQAVKQSEATSSQSEAAVLLAQRQQALRDRGTRPVERLAAQAEVESATQALAVARERLDQLEVRAPFAGVISTVNVKAGEQTGSPSAPPGVAPSGIAAAPFTMIDSSALFVRVGFPDVDLTRLVVGQKAVVVLDALPDSSIVGSVLGIEPAPTVVNTVSTTYVRIALLSQPKGMRVGMAAAVRVVVAETPNAIVIPAAGLTESLGVLSVKKVSPKSGTAISTSPTTGNTVITEVTVKTGERSDGRVQIVSGLSTGDVVVVPETVVAK